MVLARSASLVFSSSAMLSTSLMWVSLATLASSDSFFNHFSCDSSSVFSDCTCMCIMWGRERGREGERLIFDTNNYNDNTTKKLHDEINYLLSFQDFESGLILLGPIIIIIKLIFKIPLINFNWIYCSLMETSIADICALSTAWFSLLVFFWWPEETSIFRLTVS